MGYQAIVIPDALAAIPAAYAPTAALAVRGGITSPGAMNIRKPTDIEASIDDQLQLASAAGMQAFFYADALLLPHTLVQREPAAFLCDDNSNRLCPAKPAVFAALQDQIRELFDRWPAAAGLVMRTGEVYPEATPHMIGSALHASTCPLCRPISLPDRLTNFIRAMHDVVIAELHKVYIHRAWQLPIPGLPNMHDDPAVYREISARLPTSPNLAFSFKFTRGDFRHDQSPPVFNPCLLADDRPKWIEFQCEPEYEGKGAFPNYQAPLWQKFLAQLCADGNLSTSQLHNRFSLWGWSRGGGWGGPYVQREEWIDANVHALAEFYKHPDASPPEIATAWVATTFNVAQSAPPTPAITELLLISAPTIHKLLYVASTHRSHHPRAPWVKDDLLDVEAVWSAAQHAVDSNRADETCHEKIEAMRGADRVRHLFDLATPELPNQSQVRALANSLAYYNSFAGTVVNLFIGFVRFTQWHRTGRSDKPLADKAANALEHAQAHWQHHTQRHALLPGAPSVFQENTLWDRTNDCLEQLQESGN